MKPGKHFMHYRVVAFQASYLISMDDLGRQLWQLFARD
jgi:hypothetical protein